MTTSRALYLAFMWRFFRGRMVRVTALSLRNRLAVPRRVNREYPRG